MNEDTNTLPANCDNLILLPVWSAKVKSGTAAPIDNSSAAAFGGPARRAVPTGVPVVAPTRCSGIGGRGRSPHKRPPCDHQREVYQSSGLQGIQRFCIAHGDGHHHGVHIYPGIALQDATKIRCV